MPRFICCWLIAVTALAVGCSKPKSGDPGGVKKYRIAVIPKGTSHDFWNSVHAGAQKAAAEHPDVVITWKGPVSEGDTNDQKQIVENFLADGYDGICLAPADAIALRKPVDEAIAHSVPILIFDSGLADQSGIISYVATDNYQGGRRAGEHLAKLLDGKGNIVLMRYDINSQSTNDRERGFLEEIKKHPDIKLLMEDKHAGPLESGAIALGEEIVAQFGDKLQGIFCPNQSTASGMLTVLKRAGLSQKVNLIGFDSGENIAAALKTGDIKATVLQDPVNMGYEAVNTMYRHLRGEKAPDRIATQEELATTENVEDARIHGLLYPEAAH